MKLDSLASLEALADKFANQSRVLVEREKKAIRQLDEHRDELKKINQEYQQAIVGRVDTTPQLLAHRRAFVDGLTEKLNELGFQRIKREEQFQQRMIEHRKRRAQHAALEVMRAKEQAKRSAAIARTEQISMEESQRVLQHSVNVVQENDHV